MNFSGKISASSVMRGKNIEHEQTPVLAYRITYPQFSVQELRTAERMNVYYSRTAQDFIRHSERELLPVAIKDYNNSIKNGFPVHEYEAQSTYTVTYNQGGVLSLYTDRYEYTGGAHGSTMRSSDTWNVRRGRRLTLSELFMGEKAYIQRIQAEIIRQIEAQMADNTGMYFDNYEELVRSTFRPEQFHLTPTGISFYFQQYDIAPYATGIPVFEIPYNVLGVRISLN